MPSRKNADKKIKIGAKYEDAVKAFLQTPPEKKKPVKKKKTS
jgi:hypothetical protein